MMTIDFNLPDEPKPDGPPTKRHVHIDDQLQLGFNIGVGFMASFLLFGVPAILASAVVLAIVIGVLGQ